MRRLTPDRLEIDARSLLIGETAVASSLASLGEGSPPDVPSAQAQLEAAFADAQQQGLAEGRRKAEAELALRVQAAETRLHEQHEISMARVEEQRQQLARLGASLQAAVARHAADCEEMAVEVAYAALVRVLGEGARERSLIPDLCRAIVREYGHPSATLRVSDLDLPLLADVELGVPVEVDRRLSPGEAVIDTARGQFECGLEVRLAAIAEALSATLAAHRGQA